MTGRSELEKGNAQGRIGTWINRCMAEVVSYVVYQVQAPRELPDNPVTTYAERE